MATEAEILTAHAALSRAIAGEKAAKADHLAAAVAHSASVCRVADAGTEVARAQKRLVELAGQATAEPAKVEPTPKPAPAPPVSSGTAPVKPPKFVRGQG